MVTSALFASLLGVLPHGALADSTQAQLPAVSPIIRVAFDSGEVVIRSWDRSQIAVVADAPISLNELPSQYGEKWIDVPVPAHEFATESFVVNLSTGEHDRFLISGKSARATVFVPANAALVAATMTNGRIILSKLRTTFVVLVEHGTAAIENVNGSGFLQSEDGIVRSDRSSLARLRVRTGRHDIMFRETCVANMEATSLNGSILFDASTIKGGTGRFSTTDGDIGLNIPRGGARIETRTPHGAMLTMLHHEYHLSGVGSEHVLTIDGSPRENVIASTLHGAILVYDSPGLDTKTLAPRWSIFSRLLHRAPPIAAE